MAKKKSNAYNLNPLIADTAACTLDHCVAVLDYVSGSMDSSAVTDNHGFGRFLVLLAVSDALRYESGKLEASHG